jgi:alanyl-tRNA synthetase
MHPLPKPSVDTGMGLERMAAVLQHVHSNYEIDLFQAADQGAAARETPAGCRLRRRNPSLKVIADHIRACSFLIADGVIPGNEGRGYVLRRIIRRAIRHGYKLGARTPSSTSWWPDLAAEMGEAYPELVAAGSASPPCSSRKRSASPRPWKTAWASWKRRWRSEDRMLDGETAFKLHDTFGFPLDLTADICRERGITVDFAGFDAAMARSGTGPRRRQVQDGQGPGYSGGKPTFHGYDRLEQEGRIVWPSTRTAPGGR